MNPNPIIRALSAHLGQEEKIWRVSIRDKLNRPDGIIVELIDAQEIQYDIASDDRDAFLRHWYEAKRWFTIKWEHTQEEPEL
jgi:hypothetical protein